MPRVTGAHLTGGSVQARCPEPDVWLLPQSGLPPSFMDNNRETVTSGNGYYAKPSAASTVWFVFEPTGNQIGACATREEALRLITLASGSGANPRACALRESAPHADGAGHEGKHLDAPPMFGWYARQHERVARSLLGRFLRYIGVRRR